MLNIFRQGGLMKAVMSGVVILIAAAFMLDFRGGAAAVVEECFVRVDKSCVQAKDYNFLLRLVPPQGATNKQLKETGFSALAAEALVERELLLSEARRLGIEVSEEDIDAELALGRVHFSWPVAAPLPQALFAGRQVPVTGALDPISYIRVKNTKTGEFDYEIYKRQVRGLMRMSPKEFKQLQHDEITASRVRALVTSAVRVSEAEAFAQFELARSRATVRYVEAGFSWFARVGGDISDEAAAKVAQDLVNKEWENQKSKWTEGCPLVSEVLLRFPAGAEADERGAQSVRADEVTALLKAGVPFTTVARVFSDSENARVGGELGCLTDAYGPVAKELIAAVSTLKAGGSTEPIETAQGFHVLQYHGKLAAADIETRGRRAVARGLAAEDSAKSRAKAFAQSVLSAGQTGKELGEAIEGLLESAVTVPAPDSSKARLVELLRQRADVPTLEIGSPFTATSTPAPGVKDRTAAKKIFAMEKDDTYLAEPVEGFGGWLAMQLKEKDLAKREDFEKDKTELLRNLQEQKRADAIASYVSRLRKGAKRIVISESLSKPASADDATEEEGPENSG
ncbi:MAG: hypothetical protein RJA70_2187 [Pseudomonadota bacterium]